MADGVMDVTEHFGSSVFNDAVMRERLPKNVYKTLRKTIDEGEELDPTIADVVAAAMKDWAIEKGATHYCHWFQPMTGSTAEKHDSFISPTQDGRVIMEFSGKELIKGEPDASSFPSGGLRATFEARGYTAWDCTSPVFVKNDGANMTLFIPCAFCSYTDHALDKKTPLLRSMEALSKQAVRVLRALGNTTSKRVTATLGSEQEYFLIDRQFADERMDLICSGRTLFGAPSPKGQELEDQYFGSLHDRIGSFMNELNTELWALGISAKTQHNEVAPAQYEIAPIFATVNVATDWNQLTMETLRDVAGRHGFMCLLHEKPFAGVNGSGKHNNWSMGTNDGINLLDPGATPHDNLVFLTFLCAIVRAVDTYAPMLRASVASASNDHRLGANEAPPAIISVFLGEQLNEIFEQLATGKAKGGKGAGCIKLGVNSLPVLPKDNTDRNRTSPFAFTGNRFEFRMVGSSMSPSGANFVLNTIVAECLSQIADELEKSKSVNATCQDILSKIAKDHKRVVFNGNNYSAEWEKEAKKRGLPNLKTTPEAYAMILSKENYAVMEKHGVLTKEELTARTETLYEQYCLALNIEAKTMLYMAKRQILPACIEYSARLADAAKSVGTAGKTQKELLKTVCKLIDTASAGVVALEKARIAADGIDHADKKADAFLKKVIPVMNKLRESVDALEEIVDASIWPLPTYAEMLLMR